MAGGRFLRQEDHPDAILAGRRELDALLGHFLAIELVRNLDQDAGPVALERVGANGAAVIEVLQDQQALLDDPVVLLSLDVGHETHTASVVFVGGVIQTLLLRYCLFHHTHSFSKLGHGLCDPRKTSRHPDKHAGSYEIRGRPRNILRKPRRFKMLQCTTTGRKRSGTPASGATRLDRLGYHFLGSDVGNDRLADGFEQHQPQASILHLLVVAHQLEVAGRPQRRPAHRQAGKDEKRLDPLHRIGR